MKYDSHITRRLALVLGLLVLAACAPVSAKPGGEEPTTTATASLPPMATSTPPTSTPATAVPSPSSAPSSTPSVQQPVMLSSIHMMTATDGWAVGQDANGRIMLRTTDSGTHWQNVSPQISQTLATTYFADSTNAWLAAFTFNELANNPTSTVTVYHTSDRGQIWQRGDAFLLSGGGGPGLMDFIDPQHGWMTAGLGAAAGSEAVEILQTVDGGAYWQQVSLTSGYPNQSTPGSLPFGCDKTGIGFRNANTGWATGACPGGPIFLFVTHDSGHTWKRQTLPSPPGYAANLFAQCQCAFNPPIFFSPQVGIFDVQIYEVTQSAYLYVTTDGGATWTPRKLPSMPIRGELNFIDANTGWMTDGKQIYATRDGGQNWTSVGQLPISGDNLVGGVDFVDANNGWVTDGKQLYVTHDGGKTWSAITSIIAGTSSSTTLPTTGGAGGLSPTPTPGPIGQGNIPLSNVRQPIDFAPGGTSATVTANLIPDVPQSFALQAQAGQNMTITANGAARAQVYDPQGNPLTGILLQPRPWSVTLPETGEYGIALAGVGSVALTVYIPPLVGGPPVPSPVTRSPISFPPGDASTTFTVNLVAGAPQGYVLRMLAGQTMYISTSGNANVGVFGPGDVKLPVVVTGRPGLRSVGIPVTGNYTVIVYGSGETTITIFVPPL
jgi:photosystem II stability/assembly factor-like uncharacterized protein